MNFKVPNKILYFGHALIIGLVLVAGWMVSLPADAANKKNNQTKPATQNSPAAIPTATGVTTTSQTTVATTSSLTTGTTATAAPPGRKPFPRPQSHTGNWIEYHGRSADVNWKDMKNACLVCHERTDCISCHNVQMPRDHTNTWRTLSHGFMAEGNRDRCLTCHRQDYCIRCHNETAPRSHIGNWASRHCTWCHYGSGFAPAENCVVCHRKALHTSAPHNVSPQLDCTQCHN
jgi:hypothetical protein